MSFYDYTFELCIPPREANCARRKMHIFAEPDVLSPIGQRLLLEFSYYFWIRSNACFV